MKSSFDGLKAVTGYTDLKKQQQSAVEPIGDRHEEKRRREAGFTLVELLVVMAILVLIASLVAPRVIAYLGTSRVKTARIQIESLSTTLELFRLDTGRYPSSEAGLDALVLKPAVIQGWNGPYLKGGRLPLDPWGRPYLYRSPGEHGEFDIYSLGADGEPGGNDEKQDVTSWSSG